MEKELISKIETKTVAQQKTACNLVFFAKNQYREMTIYLTKKQLVYSNKRTTFKTIKIFFYNA